MSVTSYDKGKKGTREDRRGENMRIRVLLDMHA